MTEHSIVERITHDLHRLCDPGDRHPGSERNRAATGYVGARMRDLGLAVQELPFEVPDWRYGAASVTADDMTIEAHPGPFSPGISGVGMLAVARSAGDLEGLDAADAVLLLCGDIAREQFTPRGYPFYANPEHAAILDALESAHPLAILAATDRSAMTAAMSPFPLIEEVGFGIPHAYLRAELAPRLAGHAGERVRVVIESETVSASGVQLVGRRPGTDPDAGTVVICAHVDTKAETPGAVDNASGVAVLLAVAESLRGRDIARAVEFVPFNGEDHTMAPGELAYLAARPDFSDIRLAVNIDGAGLAGGPAAYSCYGLDESAEKEVAAVVAGFPAVCAGPGWPASDHMVLAMRGVPAMAFTSSDFAAFTETYAHTSTDTPAILDPDVLAETARCIAELVARL